MCGNCLTTAGVEGPITLHDTALAQHVGEDYLALAAGSAIPVRPAHLHLRNQLIRHSAVARLLGSLLLGDAEGLLADLDGLDLVREVLRSTHARPSPMPASTPTSGDRKLMPCSLF